jgi:hypothetical protein
MDGPAVSPTDNCSASTIGEAEVGRNTSGNLAGGVSCTLLLGGSRYTLQAKSSTDNREPTQRKYLKIGIGQMLRSRENAIGICVNAVDRQVGPLGTDRPPYRTQWPLTRRKPAAQACRTVVLRLHTPLTRCIPGPHASRTSVTMSSSCSCWTGATGMACVEEASPKTRRSGAIAFIALLPKKQVGTISCNYLKSIEPDIPLFTWYVRISDSGAAI